MYFMLFLKPQFFLLIKVNLSKEESDDVLTLHNYKLLDATRNIISSFVFFDIYFIYLLTFISYTY